MSKLTKIAMGVALLGSAFAATAAPIPIDLSSWQSDGQGSWSVQGTNNDSVVQLQNGQPTVFYDASSNAQNTSISGEITVETTGDDDFIGFVLGYQSGEITSSTSEYILIDWKQGLQTFSGLGTAVPGLALSMVNGATTETEFWEHDGGVTEIARATNLGSTGWVDNQTYSFDIVFTSSLIQVLVDGVLELSVTAAQANVNQFSDGAAGFYNYSQNAVRYAGIAEEQIVNANAPGALALIMLGGLVILRRRK